MSTEFIGLIGAGSLSSGLSSKFVSQMNAGLGMDRSTLPTTALIFHTQGTGAKAVSTQLPVLLSG